MPGLPLGIAGRRLANAVSAMPYPNTDMAGWGIRTERAAAQARTGAWRLQRLAAAPTCPLCGGAILAVKCKAICQTCGFTTDCSD